MVLKDASGASVPTGEAAFHAAMAAPEPGGPAAPSPPPPPPVDPDAPYGRRADGTPKKGPGGRPPKDADRPRVTDQAPAAAGGQARDYTEGLAQLAGIVHLGLLTQQRTHAHAALWRGTSPQMVAAWNAAAQQNAMVRTGVEYLAGSSVGWVIGVTVATMPFAQGCYALWKDPESEAAKKLAASSRDDLERAAAMQEAAMLAAAGVRAA